MNAPSETRFCPSCGTKAKANPELFSAPQTCPNCKIKVLFWDVTKEPAGEIVNVLKHKPLLPANTIPIIAIATVSIVLFVLLLYVVGFVGIPFTISVFFLIAGAYALATFFVQQYKTVEQAKTIEKLLASLASAREQQVSLAIKYASLQENFQALLAEKTKEAEFAKTDFELRKRTLEAEHASTMKLLHEDTHRIRQDCKMALFAIAEKYVSETRKQIASKLTVDNYSASKDRFLKAVEFCRKQGFFYPEDEVAKFLRELKDDYAEVVKKQAAKEEQARIREKIREEQKVEAEIERERKKLEQEELLLQRLLDEARAKVNDESSAMIADLERRLEEAQSKERSLSQAQLTKAGNVYVISNIGSFGDNVFKIGMTRRLEPMDRVKELGDASVPFPFDVHMMIACENAPTLENELHRMFTEKRLNKVNFKKEFFRVTIDEIISAVEELHGQVEYVATPEALQYHESLTMTAEELAIVAKVSDDINDDEE
jgi:hypothetical protein